MNGTLYNNAVFFLTFAESQYVLCILIALGHVIWHANERVNNYGTYSKAYWNVILQNHTDNQSHAYTTDHVLIRYERGVGSVHGMGTEYLWCGCPL